MAELIVALDVDERSMALELAHSVKGYVDWLKIGLELFISCGPSLLEQLRGMGFKIFLDLKFYDIPNTVAAAVRSASGLGADLLTIHCQGGERMCQAALEASRDVRGARPLIFGVTVLTSFADGELPGISMSARDYALFLARCACNWGLPGVVCSGMEAGAIKAMCPSLLLLCPGIRPAGYGKGDQRRTVTPAEAISSGADFLVIGRPIIKAANPQAMAAEIRKEMNAAVAQDSRHNN